jgi:hypothetical protein
MPVLVCVCGVPEFTWDCCTFVPCLEPDIRVPVAPDPDDICLVPEAVLFRVLPDFNLVAEEPVPLPIA